MRIARYLLISHVGPDQPVAQAQVNSMTGDAAIADAVAVVVTVEAPIACPPLFELGFGCANSMLRTSTGGRLGLPIELMPCMPRTTIGNVVFSSEDPFKEDREVAADVVFLVRGSNFLVGYINEDIYISKYEHHKKNLTYTNTLNDNICYSPSMCMCRHCDTAWWRTDALRFRTWHRIILRRTCTDMHPVRYSRRCRHAYTARGCHNS